MKKVIKLLLSRMFIIAFMVFLQLGWVVLILYDASRKSDIVQALIHILALVIVMLVLQRWNNPSIKLGWVFLILAVPLVGVPVYLIFGRKGLTKKTRLRMNEASKDMERTVVQNPKVWEHLSALDERALVQSNYLLKKANAPVYEHTHTTYFTCGEEMFPRMLEDIRQAKRYIFLEYFILDQGQMYDQLVDALAERVRAGVEVRLIYDDFGCMGKMPAHFYRELQQKGIKCAAFNTVRPIMAIIMNHRDHRKLLSIDGTISYTGGINIADEYVNRIDRFGYWKDTGVRMEGDASISVTRHCLEMWDYIVNTQENLSDFLPEPMPDPIESQGFVQPYVDTPLDAENVGENVYLNLINRATRYVYFFTPYLVLDQELMIAFENAAKSGVDVRLVLPGIPDKKLVYCLSRSHYKKLVEAGVKIYEYTPGFLHAKCAVCDDEYATVGSINLDYRSLYLHFECGVFMVHTPVVKSLYDDFDRVFRESKQITPEMCQRKHPFVVELFYTFLRLIAPLL